MTYLGITMDVSGVIPGIQIIEHRILHYIDPNLSDDQIKHQLAFGYYTDFAFSKPLTLSGILDDCIKYKVIPIVNLCITEGSWKKHTRLTPEQAAKIGGLLRDYLKSRGFIKGTAYQALFNEPNTQVNLTSKQVCDYTNVFHNKVGADFDVVYGNDEFGNLDWNYLGTNCKAKIQGVHPLSSLGSWAEPKKYFTNIRDWKTIANQYNKDVIAIESGSWFKDYQSDDGHKINLEIMAECKKYDYLGCLIVLPDINQESRKRWNLLGYRVWNSDFTQIVSQNEQKFNEFIEFVKREGKQMEYLRPDELQAVCDFFGIKFPYNENLPNTFVAGRKDPNKMITWADLDAMEETKFKTLISAFKKMGLAVPDYPNIKYNSDGTWNSNWQLYARSKTKP